MPLYRLLIIFIVFLSVPLIGQEIHPDTSFKNTVRLNLTPLLVTARAESATVGYERLLKKNQSFSANIGHLSLPALVTTKEGSPVEWISSIRNTGFIVSADYRFYFKRNRYLAPDGLYWGPYMAYYYADKASRVNLLENNAVQAASDVQAYMNIFHAGLQLGYQFVFWDRWTLDLILVGPGFGFYGGQISVDPDIEISGDEEYIQEIFDALKEIFPASQTLLDERTVSTSGSFGFQAIGYRMAVQVGFRF